MLFNSILHAMKAIYSNSWRDSRMLLTQCIPSIPCSFYSHIPCRSYVTNRMGDLVPPTWPSSTQWDKGSCITIRVWIHVTQYLIHAVMHPLHIWTSVRASTRRWYSISTKSPYSAIPFDLSENCMLGPQNEVSMHQIYIILPPNRFPISQDIWSGWVPLTISLSLITNFLLLLPLIILVPQHIMAYIYNVQLVLYQYLC